MAKIEVHSLNDNRDCNTLGAVRKLTKYAMQIPRGKGPFAVQVSRTEFLPGLCGCFTHRVMPAEQK